MIRREVLTDDQAERKLLGLKERAPTLREELDNLPAQLADLPDDQTVRGHVEKVQDTILVDDQDGSPLLGGNDLATFPDMTDDDRRELIRAVFGDPLGDGKPAGVYATQVGDPRPHRPKEWEWKIRGRLEFEFVMQKVRC
ncbi:MAG: hypothetical protein L0Z62_45845 [Gemmataceae bacterium]|nr:hypothetical protein [Gemmataceae bacterium]